MAQGREEKEEVAEENLHRLSYLLEVFFVQHSGKAARAVLRGLVHKMLGMAVFDLATIYQQSKRKYEETVEGRGERGERE